jgi:photosystem II stability/assembly factor-like uncharacterized protein
MKTNSRALASLGVTAFSLGMTGSVVARTAGGQVAPVFNEQTVKGLTYRNVGPFRMGARVSSIAVPNGKAHVYTFYVGFWTGGLWRTTNNGTTFEPIFDGHDKLAIGAVAIAPSNPDIVWVGTGDAFTSRSSLAGDGVYKSTDAGKTWTNVGLKDSHHISRIAIDPANPNTVYVAAMGHLFSENAERGVFKTVDGGRSWEKILYVDEGVGVVDLVMHPTNPAVLYAATYDKKRLPWQIVNGGPRTAIYKTINGGKTWTKLAGGLPAGQIGRIGLAMYPTNPEILYAVIENENPRNGAATRQGFGEVYRTQNGGKTWAKMSGDFNVSPKGPYYFSQIFVDPGNDKRIYVTQDNFFTSGDGGKTWNDTRPFPRMFGDFRTLWIDREDPSRMVAGSDGGIAISYDGGRTSDAPENIPVGENYKVFVDVEEPYNIYAGIQDHEHWKGPSNVPSRGATVWDWLALGGGDGIYVVPDTTADGHYVYTTREYGQHFRLDQRLGVRVSIMPRRTTPGAAPYRFIWEAPIYISPHNSSTIYAGAQVLLKSMDHGDHWTEISPDLSTNPADKILPSSEGGVPGGIPWFAISSISESPIAAGVIWAGTSDGKLHVTRDGGTTWSDVTASASTAGVREDAYVSTIRASRHVLGRAFLSKSGYRFDDFKPYLAMTEDFGATWTSIAGNLPSEPINVIWEDTKNPNLLFVGNDGGAFVSIDRGAHWVKMNNNMPSISVKDLAVHPRDQDLVLGSYARGIWVTNIAPLQELTASVLAEDAHLFTILPTTQRIPWSFGANDYLFGQRHLQTPNDPDGMAIYYYLKNAGSGPVTIAISDTSGKEVARLSGPSAAGINRVVWSTRLGGGRGGAVLAGAGRGGRGAAAAAVGETEGAPAGRGSTNPLDQWMPLGEYRVTLDVGGKTFVQSARIVKTIGWSLNGATSHVIR